MEERQEKASLLDVQYTQLEFDGSETLMSCADEDRSVARSVITGVGEMWDDDASVAREGMEAPLKRKLGGRPRIEGVVRDKRGNIIRTRGIAGCQYRALAANVKRHKVAKHGIDVVWFSCDQDNCDYKASGVAPVRFVRL